MEVIGISFRNVIILGAKETNAGCFSLGVYLCGNVVMDCGHSVQNAFVVFTHNGCGHCFRLFRLFGRKGCVKDCFGLCVHCRLTGQGEFIRLPLRGCHCSIRKYFVRGLQHGRLLSSALVSLILPIRPFFAINTERYEWTVAYGYRSVPKVS